MSKLRFDKSVFNASKPSSSANRSKKLEGSFGLTAIVQMPEAMQICVRKLLNSIIAKESLKEVQPKKFGLTNKFIDVTTGQDESITADCIAPIENLHTTLASWQVMDAVSEQQWKNELIRSRMNAILVRRGCDIFSNGFHRTLVFDAISSTDVATEEYLKHLKKYVQENIHDEDESC